MDLRMMLVVALVGCGGPAFSTETVPGDDAGGDAVVRTDGDDAGRVATDAGATEAEASPPQGDAGDGGSGSSSGGSSSSSSSSSGGSSSSSSSSGATSACDGGPSYVHDAGNGVTWTDCVPTGTRTEAEAMAACEAWCAASNCTSPCVEVTDCYSTGGVLVSTDLVKNNEVGWSYSGSYAGKMLSETTCIATGTWN